MNLFIGILFGFLAFVGTHSLKDKECAAREVPGRSVLCVCNSTYCDDVTRDPVYNNGYVVYTSSKAGLRFSKTNGSLEEQLLTSAEIQLELDPDTKYQTIEGFGGAVTDAAGINVKSLPLAAQEKFIESYFSDHGIEYSMLRVPIGGTDFSTHAYAYNEYPVGDTYLSNFTLAYEDFEYKIPLINKIMEAAVKPVHIVSTCWSPPTWMKSNKDYTGVSHLLDEYYETYALYHMKFIEAYQNEGIEIWAVTTSNEPADGLVPAKVFDLNDMGWTPKNMGKWIGKYLGPAIKNSTLRDVKILGHDDQRASLPLFVNTALAYEPDAEQYMDGIAVHWYLDPVSPPSMLTDVAEAYPSKFIIYTEACAGYVPLLEHVALGSWDRAASYVSDMIDVLNHHVVGWIDWNICLNPQGGPTYIDNFVDSPILVYEEIGEFVKQPLFYVIGHMSKFVPRGSVRINVTETTNSGAEYIAFSTPRETIVVVVLNKSSSAKTLAINIGESQAVISVEADSITTVELAGTQ